MLNYINNYNAGFTKYFSWGDIIGQNKNGSGSYSFSEANYKAGACGSGHNLTGNIPQGNATYDAATANMGSPWKMPTKDQCQELKNTNHTWTTINGVNGGKFTSKTDSSKYIFLPAGGQWSNTNFFGTNTYNYSWTTIKHFANDSFVMYVFNDIINTPDISRCLGCSVRAIQLKTKRTLYHRESSSKHLKTILLCQTHNAKLKIKLSSIFHSQICSIQ